MSDDQSVPTPQTVPPSGKAARRAVLAAGKQSLLPAFAFDPRWRLAALAFLLLTTTLRLFQLSALELAPDEAYYWDWSRHLSLGYYDQGPMIAYVIRLTTALFGANEFGVRCGVLAASCGALACCYVLAERLFAPMAGFLTVVLLALTPLMAVGSLIATYDPLLVFFWAWTLVFLERALFSPDLKTQRRAWLGAGLTTGLGFLSKHTMLLLLPCLLLFLTLSPPHRFWLRRPEPYLAFALTLLLYSGVFWWNAHHHWWTFGHLLFLSKAGGGKNALARLGDFLGSQALLLGPALFWGALGVGRWALGKNRRGEGETQLPNYPTTQLPNTQHPTPNTLFLACLGLPVFAFFCLVALKAKVQANWAPCAWLSLTVLWAGGLCEAAGRSRQAARRAMGWFALAALTGGLLTGVLLLPGLRATLGIRLAPQTDVSNQTFGWRELAARVQQTRSEMERAGRKPFLVSNSYQYAALLAFYLPDHPETQTLFLHFRLNMYAAHVERLKAHLEQDAIFVDDTRNDEPDLRQLFARVEWETPLEIWRRPLYDQPIKTLHIARCTRFLRYIGLEWAVGG